MECFHFRITGQLVENYLESTQQKMNDVPSATKISLVPMEIEK